jgi:putative transposase
MDEYLPASAISFCAKAAFTKDVRNEKPPKDWPHAPVHRLCLHGIYIVTLGTVDKRHFFDTPQKKDMLERMLLSLARQKSWQLEAWAVLDNHYHFIARGAPNSMPMAQFLKELHSRSAISVNELDGVAERTVWYNFWDTKLTHQYSYLARLKYVHQNPVKHKLVAVANQYPWCSAAWFERTASPAQVKTIYSFKTDQLKVEDDF